MKTSAYVLLTMTLLLAGGLSPLKAQGPKEPKAAAGESRKEARWEKMGLSKEQGEKLEASMKAEREAMKPLHREMRDALTKLRDLVEDKAADKDLQAAIDRVGKARKAIQAEHERFEASLSTLPVQARAKMLLHMSGPMGGGMGMGPGGPGAMGGMQRAHPRMGGKGMKGGPGGPDMENRPPQGPPDADEAKEGAGD